MSRDRTEEWWCHFGKCIHSVLESAQPTTSIWLSRGGYPTTYPGFDFTLVGTYTPIVTVKQLLEDIDEAMRTRKRRNEVAQ